MENALLCRVNFLDDTHFRWNLQRDAVGEDLFNKVCEHLNLLERDYYSLFMWDSPTIRVWLDFSKEIQKQIKGPVAEFFFSVKFYPPDHLILAEEITRYLLCLQLRGDILSSRLPCPPDSLALLGSYTVQSTLGDYDPNLHQKNYLSEILLAPNQTQELEDKVMELHSTYRMMSPVLADMLFLENAVKLPMYGVDLHPAKDIGGADVMVGVCSEGLIVYEENIKTSSFFWPRVMKISHKRSFFHLKIRASEEESSDDVTFILPSYRACKQLWRCSVEHHSFFRNRLQDTKAERLLKLGSRFCYYGRTHSECLEASGNISRAPPPLMRFAFKRRANEELLESLKKPVRAEWDDWYLVLNSDKWNISSSDEVTLESPKLQDWKQQADDWFLLLDGSQFSLSGFQQNVAQEEMEITERVDIQKRSALLMEGLEKRDDVQSMPTETRTEEFIQVNGGRIQKVVITKQWAQEINVEPEENKEDRLERIERTERRVIVSEEQKQSSAQTSEGLKIMKQRLKEVEIIEESLLKVETLRIGIQEVEILKQKLEQMEKVGLQPGPSDDWYILLDRRPSVLTVFTRAEEDFQEIRVVKLMKTDDDWHLLLEVLPQSAETSQRLTGVSTTSEDHQTGDERRETHLTTHQESVNPKTTTIESKIETHVIQKEQQDVTVNYGRSRSDVLEQSQEQPGKVVEDDWFLMMDASTGPGANPHLRGTAVDRNKETQEDVRTEQSESKQVMERTSVTYGDPEDDWYILLDAAPRESVPLVSAQQQKSVKLHVEKREIIYGKVTTQEELRKPPEKPRKQPDVVVLAPERDVEDDWFIIFDVPPKDSEHLADLQPTGPATEKLVQRNKGIEVKTTAESKWKKTQTISERPRETDDDWFQLYDPETREQRSLISESVTTETRIVKTIEEITTTKAKEEQVSLDPRRTRAVLMQPHSMKSYEVSKRNIEDDWFIIFDVAPKESALSYSQLRDTATETPEKEIPSKAKTELQVVIAQTVTKTVRVGQVPMEHPERLEEVQDDWFQLFDQVPRALQGLSSDAQTKDFEFLKLLKDQTSQRLMGQPIKEKRVTLEENMVINERRGGKYVVAGKIPHGVREVDDVWFELLDQTPIPIKSISSVVTEMQILKDQEVKRVRQQERVLREEEERRQKEQVKQELERCQARPSHSGIEDDWFILFSSLPKEAGDTRVNWIAEEVKKRWEEESKTQMKVEDQKRLAKKHVQLQRKAEYDWFTLMGLSPKDRVSPLPRQPVLSPMASSKAWPQVPSAQLMTSTPTTQPVSFTTASYTEKAKDTLNITLESETDTESMLIRESRKWTKRIEGESIYVRHSILMLEDLDLSQELMLKHHASISKLKRNFMEAMVDFGPTEWDRRLSSYSPSSKPQLPHANGQILISMGLIEDEGKTVL